MSSRQTNTVSRQGQTRNPPPSGSSKPRRSNQPHLSRSERQRRKIRRSFRRKVSARIAFIIMTLAAAFLAVTIFFKIDNINITPTEHYSVEDIQSTLGIEKGDNMFTFKTSSLQKKLLKKFPYLESVTITRSLPDTIVVKAKDSVPAMALTMAGTGYCLTDENGKMLEQVASIPKSVPSVTGITVSEVNPGSYLDTEKDEKSKALVKITKEFEKRDMIKDVNFINVSALDDIRVGYLGRLDVRLGNADKLSEKMQMLVHIVNEELSPSDVQIIYLEDPATVYCPPTTLEKIQQSAMPVTGQDEPKEQEAPTE